VNQLDQPASGTTSKPSKAFPIKRMATSKAEGNKSGGDFPDAQKSSKGLVIQQLERKAAAEDAKGTYPKSVNLLLCAVALLVLYGYYILFGYAWLTAMVELGDDLNWAFFGLMVAVGGGMMSGVAYSMKSQKKGIWKKWEKTLIYIPKTEKQAEEWKRVKKYRLGKCCTIWNLW